MRYSPDPPQNERQESLTSCSLSAKIVAAVTTQADITRDELDPLYEAIDPDALNALFAPTYQGTPRTSGTVRFHYAGCRVTVTADRTVTVVPSDTPKTE